MQVKPKKVWPTTDGREWPTREAALVAQRGIVRKERLTALLSNAELDDLAFMPNEGTELAVSVSDIPQLIASFGDEILEALTIKRNYKPRTKSE